MNNAVKMESCKPRGYLPLSAISVCIQSPFVWGGGGVKENKGSQSTELQLTDVLFDTIMMPSVSMGRKVSKNMGKHNRLQARDSTTLKSYKA